MPELHRWPALASLALIAIVIGVAAAAFGYTAGWFSPQRLTPDRLVTAFAPPTGVALGHRRNHAKGICFTGVFEANGAGSELSQAEVFARGQYPVLGRFNLGTADPNAPDATVRVRGLSMRISTPDGQEWRSAMINPPVFPVSTPEAFYELLRASGSKDPNAMKTFATAHPEFATFGDWAENAPWTGSYAEERFNSINSFVFVDRFGAGHVVRWSLLPAAQPVTVSPDELAKRGPDFLEQEIAQRVARAPQRWTMVVTVANSSDLTADPTKPWPADRRVPTAKSIALLVNPTNPAQAAAQTEELQAAVRALGLHLEIAKASNPIEIADAFATLVRNRVEALQIGVDPVFGNHIDQIVALAQIDKIPTIYPWREFTAAGGLMNYGASIPDAFRQVGVYTGQILKGANPAELPVQRPTKLKLVVSLKAARALGTEFPAKLLARADEVIE